MSAPVIDIAEFDPKALLAEAVSVEHLDLDAPFRLIEVNAAGVVVSERIINRPPLELVPVLTGLPYITK